MKRPVKQFFTTLLAIVLAGGTVLGNSTYVVRAEQPGGEKQVEVSSNTAADSFDIDRDDVVTYQGITTAEADELERKLREKYGEDIIETSLITEDDSYLTESAWDNISMLRGTQSSGQVFMNLQMQDLWGSVYDTRFDFEGRTYYFKMPYGYINAVSAANSSGKPISIELLLGKTTDGEALKLYDPDAFQAALSSGARPPYFAPNIRRENSNYYRAELAFLAQIFSRKTCHIDNWIVGNEVNMPNSWYYTGNADPEYNTELYAEEYLGVYNAVRKYTSKSRISFCFDHSWQHNDEGRGIAVKDYLTLLVDKINRKQANVDWTISYHMYPAYLPEAAIWTSTPFEGRYGSDLNPRDTSAKFVDGYNLFVFTDFVKNNYGTSHRIMCTEQGFSRYMGDNIQAAGLALSYYAAKYDPMVDAFIINDQDEGGIQDFSLSDTAQIIWDNLDSNPVLVESSVLPIIGIGSFAEVVPNYGRETLKADRTKVKAFVTRLYELALERKPEEQGLNFWTDCLCNGEKTGAEVAGGFFFSPEMDRKNLDNEEFLERLYTVMMNRPSDAGGKKYWLDGMNNGFGRQGVFRGFCNSPEFNRICATYGIIPGTYEVSGSSRSMELSAFVSRLYTKALGRTYDQDGLDYWCENISNQTYTINQVSTEKFFHSDEFLRKQLNDRQYLEVLYRTFMGREYDEEGLQYWLVRLNSKELNRDDVLNKFVSSPEFTKIKAGFGF